MVLVLVLVCFASAQAAPKGTLKALAKTTAYSKLPVPKKGGTFYDRTKINPITLNPILVTNLDDRPLASLLFMSLLSRDPETYEHVPALAESVETSKDKKEYTFKLRADAKWTDGTAVTADDVLFTFQKIMDPKVEAAAIRSFLGGVTAEKVDELRIKFKVETPKFNSLDFIAGLQPIQKKQFENEKDFNKSKENLKPIGNTGYRFKSLSRDQNVMFEYVPGWWGEKEPEYRATQNFSTYQFRVIPDETLAYERMLKGELDVMEVAADKFATQVRGVDKDRVGTKPNSGKTVWADQFRSDGSFPWFGMGLNYNNPIFTKATRQALAYLTDYDTIIKKAFFGLPDQCLIPFGSTSRNLHPSLKDKKNQYRFDMKKGLALLKADGWADTDGDNVLDKVINGKKTPFQFTFKYSASSNPAASTAQILKETYKKAGIQFDVRAVEGAALYKDFEERQYDAVFMGWGGGSIYPDPRQIWHSQSISGGGSNTVGYANPKVDQLIDQANLEFDPKKRTKLLQEIGKILYEDLPYLFLVERHYSLEVLNSRIKSPKWMFRYGTSVARDLFYAE